MPEVTLRWCRQDPVWGGVGILLVASCYGHRDKPGLTGDLALMQTLPTYVTQTYCGVHKVTSL